MIQRNMAPAWTPFAAAWLLLGPWLHAAAGPVPSGVSDPPLPEGPFYRYVYEVNLAAGTQVNSGDYFTIYDFSALVPLSNLQPANWAFGISPLGPTPEPLAGLAADDDAVANLTWTYAGEAPVVAGESGLRLGFFSALSTLDSSAPGVFTSVSHHTSGGEPVYVLTSTKVPHGVADVPEPATLGLMAVGLLIAGVVRLIRRRKAMVVAKRLPPRRGPFLA